MNNDNTCHQLVFKIYKFRLLQKLKGKIPKERALSQIEINYKNNIFLNANNIVWMENAENELEAQKAVSIYFKINIENIEKYSTWNKIL